MRQVLEFIVEQIISGESEDKLYFQAIEDGDEELVKRMVEEKAKRNGYNVEAWHGSDYEEFYEFEDQNTAYGFFFTPDIESARYYGTPRRFLLQIQNLADLTDFEIFNKIGEEAIWSTDIKRDEEELKNWIKEKIPNNSGGVSFAKRLLNLSDDEFEEYEKWEDVVDDLAREADEVVDELKENFPKAYEQLNREVPLINQELEYAREAHDNLSQDWYMQYQDDFTKSANKMGYDGVFMYDPSSTGTPESYVVFSPEQIKLADPITKDDQGNIIPLSKRFDSSNPDIRY